MLKCHSHLSSRPSQENIGPKTDRLPHLSIVKEIVALPSILLILHLDLLGLIIKIGRVQTLKKRKFSKIWKRFSKLVEEKKIWRQRISSSRWVGTKRKLFICLKIFILFVRITNSGKRRFNSSMWIHWRKSKKKGSRWAARSEQKVKELSSRWERTLNKSKKTS